MNISIILPLIGLLLHGCQIFVAPRLRLFGYYDKTLRSLNNDKCRPIPEFEGCEDIKYHPSEKVLYLSCAPIHNRLQWGPGFLNYNHTYKLDESNPQDYIGMYDLKTEQFSVLTPNTYPLHGRGLSTHGIDVVDNKDGSATLYLVNHGPNPEQDPLHPTIESVEVYKAYPGKKTMTYERTFENDDVMLALNAVSADGRGGIYFTNDKPNRHHRKYIDDILALSDFLKSTIGHCNANNECKVVDTFESLNGLTRINENQYIANTMFSGRPIVLDRKDDDSLVFNQNFHLGSVIDNVFYNEETDEAYVAAFPKFKTFQESMEHPYSHRAPVYVYKLHRAELSRDTARHVLGRRPYPGEKVLRWRAGLLMGDDGSNVSSVTSVAGIGNKIYMSGYIHPNGYVCELD